MKEKDTIAIVKQALDDEISSLVHFRDQLDPSVKDCIDLILKSTGKVIVTGVGKSGDIAKKFPIHFLPREPLLTFCIQRMHRMGIRELLDRMMLFLPSEKVGNQKNSIIFCLHFVKLGQR